MTAIDRFFIDTAPFIYLIEKHPNFYDPVINYLSTNIAQGVAPLTSVVSYTEFCVKPNAGGDSKTILNFEKMLKKIGCPIAPINLPIAKIAYPLRAKYTFLKASDSFQIAAALHFGCREFLTNDFKLSNVTEIKVVLISNLYQAEA